MTDSELVLFGDKFATASGRVSEAPRECCGFPRTPSVSFKTFPASTPSIIHFLDSEGTVQYSTPVHSTFRPTHFVPDFIRGMPLCSKFYIHISGLE